MTGDDVQHSSSSSIQPSMLSCKPGGSRSKKRRAGRMTQLAALQPLALFTLLSFSPLLRLCAAQNDLFPPLPPLGLFGGLLDGLGLGPSSPAATNSPPASPTYTQPPTSPATRQSSSRGSDASGTIIPVVTTPPASSTPTAPAASTLVPASPAATAAPSTPSSPAAAADDDDNPAAQGGPAAGQSVSNAPSTPALTPAPLGTGVLPGTPAAVPSPTPGSASAVQRATAVATPAPTVTAAPAQPASTPAAVAAVSPPTLTPASTQAPAATPVAAAALTPPAPTSPPTPTPTPAQTPADTPAAAMNPRRLLPPQPPPLPHPTQLPLKTPAPTPTPTPMPISMVPLPAELAPLLVPSPQSAPPPAMLPPPSPPPPPFAVQDPAETALSAAFLVQGPDVWPFDSSKQALFVSALQSVLPGVGPGGITVTSAGAPFRRRALLQAVSSALVATQVDAGSAAQVPVVLAQLRNATDQGQLTGAMQSQGLHVSSLQLQAATGVVPTSASAPSSALSVPFIVGIIVVVVVVLLCIFGGAYFGLFRCCMPNMQRKAEEAQRKDIASKGGAQNDVSPFFEVPKFQQTYTRAPSLVAQTNPAFGPARPPRHPGR